MLKRSPTSFVIMIVAAVLLAALVALRAPENSLDRQEEPVHDAQEIHVNDSGVRPSVTTTFGREESRRSFNQRPPPAQVPRSRDVAGTTTKPASKTPEPLLPEDLNGLEPAYDPATAFDEAGSEFNVPPELLKAIAVVESQGEHRSGSSSGDKGPRGVMNLRESEERDTLVEAAELLGMQPRQLVVDPFQNIRGAAAVLRRHYERAQAAAPDTNGWIVALTYYSGLPEEEALRYAALIKAVLTEGAHQPVSSGGSIEVPPGKHALLE